MQPVVAPSRVLAVLASLVLTACSYHISSVVTQSQPGGQISASGIDLPRPAELAARQPSFTEAGLLVEGDKFEASLPHWRVYTGNTDAWFQPMGDLGWGPQGIAYAVWSFGVGGYDRSLSLRLSWLSHPPLGSAWVGLANFATGRWEWSILPPDDVVHFTDLAAHTSPAPGSRLYAAVLVGRGQGAQLGYLRIGDPPAPTLAKLQATPVKGAAPLVVIFNTTDTSFDPQIPIVKYEYDFGEGGGFEDWGMSVGARHIYNRSGRYTPRLRVTDKSGRTAMASATVKAWFGGYSEIGSLTLPAFPFTGFTGSLGDAPSYVGYDGGSNDNFRFSAPPGRTVEFTIDFDTSSGGKFGQEIFAVYPSYYEALDFSQTTTSPCVLRRQGLPEEFGNYGLNIFSDGNFYGDYAIAGRLLPVGAKLVALPDRGPAPLTLQLDASATTVDPPATIVSYEFDPLGDGNFSVPQPTPDFKYTYPAGMYVAQVRITDDQGDAEMASAGVLAGLSYGEMEDNDAPATATPLTFPVSGMTGSIGAAPGYAGYDGDYMDYFGPFNATAGQLLSVDMTIGGAISQLAIVLTDVKGTNITGYAGGSGNHAVFSYGFNWLPNIVGPYYLKVYAQRPNGGYADYQFDAMLTP